MEILMAARDTIIMWCGNWLLYTLLDAAILAAWECVERRRGNFSPASKRPVKPVKKPAKEAGNAAPAV